MSNLSKPEMRGLFQIKKRVDNGTAVVLETDKTGKLSICSIETYEELGQPHVSKDREIDQDQVDEKERYLNGHVSMLLKIFSFGKNWQHEERHRESQIKHSGFVANMSLKDKDHKILKPGQVRATRAVVSANQGIATSMSNILSEVLEPVADSLVDKTEIISTEDGISRYDDCNEKLACEWKEGDKIGLIGADVSNLFGSMSAHKTSQVVGKVFLESDIKVEGVNYSSAAMYVRYEIRDDRRGDPTPGPHPRGPGEALHPRQGPRHHQRRGHAQGGGER